MNKEINELTEELESIPRLDLSDQDVIDLLQEIRGTADPSFARTYDLLANLREEILVNEDILKDAELEQMRRRHLNLTKLNESKAEMNGLNNDLVMVRGGPNLSPNQANIQLEEKTYTTQSLGITEVI